jgi:membrane protease YdiL (CAAX protease family)
MQYRSVKGLSGFAQFGILMGLLLFGLILAGIAQYMIAIRMMPEGISITEAELLKATLDPKNVAWARASQVAGTFFLMFIPAVLFTFIVHGSNKFWLGFNSHINLKQVVIGFLIIMAATVMSGPLGDLSKSVVANFPSLDQLAKKLEALYNEQAKILSNLTSWPEYFMALVIMAFFPALFEEVFFRGVMQNLFIKWWKAPLIAIIMTSLIFSLVHTSIYFFLSRAVLGFVLGMLYYKTKNIWVPVMVHFINNALAVSQLFWMSQTGQKVDVNKLDVSFDWWYAVIALVVLILLFRLLDKVSANKRAKILQEEQALLSQPNMNDPFKSKSDL